MVTTRRQVIATLAAAAVGAPVVAWWSSPAAPVAGTYPFTLSDREWRRRLAPAAYAVLRTHATERAFTSPLDREHRRGTFACAGCGQPLFASTAKFDSGTGWPSFSAVLDEAVGTSVDTSWLMVRTEVHCARCGGHLGHLFSDGPPPSGLRYCINGVALRFQPA